MYWELTPEICEKPAAAALEPFGGSAAAAVPAASANKRVLFIPNFTGRILSTGIENQ
jgi:hypothetical protein